MTAPDPAAALTALLLAKFPGVPIAPAKDRDGNPVPGGGTFGAFRAVLADLIALNPRAAQAAVDLAAARHMISNTLPTEGEIRSAFAELSNSAQRAPLDAWGDVKKLMGRFSIYRYPTETDVTDPLVWQCIQDIGWRSLCNADETDPAPRSQFVAAYGQRQQLQRSALVTATVPSARRILEERSTGQLMSDALKRLTGGVA